MHREKVVLTVTWHDVDYTDAELEYALLGAGQLLDASATEVNVEVDGKDAGGLCVDRDI